jgi:hypothetical protein
MKQITAEDVRLLQKETGEGMMACKKILVERYRAEEKLELTQSVQEIKRMLNASWETYDTRDILLDVVELLDKLVRRS